MDKFYCPECKEHRRIEAVTINAECHQTVIMENNELRYGEITIDDGVLDRFQCEVCGYMIPDETDDPEKNLIELLQNQIDPVELELIKYKRINADLLRWIIEVKRLVQQSIKAQANRPDRKTLEVVNKGCDKVARICNNLIEKYRNLI